MIGISRFLKEKKMHINYFQLYSIHRAICSVSREVQIVSFSNFKFQINLFIKITVIIRQLKINSLIVYFILLLNFYLKYVPSAKTKDRYMREVRNQFNCHIVAVKDRDSYSFRNYVFLDIILQKKGLGRSRKNFELFEDFEIIKNFVIISANNKFWRRIWNFLYLCISNEKSSTQKV